MFGDLLVQLEQLGALLVVQPTRRCGDRIGVFDAEPPRRHVEVLEEQEMTDVSVEVEALMRTVREQTEKIMSLRGILSSDLIMIMNNIDDPGRLADLVASNLRLKIPEAQSILECIDPVEKLRLVADYLNKELEVSTMQAKIQTEAKEEMTRSQREYYLREQLQALKKELGDIDERSQEIEELRGKLAKKRMPPSRAVSITSRASFSVVQPM